MHHFNANRIFLSFLKVVLVIKHQRIGTAFRKNRGKSGGNHLNILLVVMLLGYEQYIKRELCKLHQRPDLPINHR